MLEGACFWYHAGAMSDVSESLAESSPGAPGVGEVRPVTLAEAAPQAAAAPVVPLPVAVRIWCAFVLSLCAGMLGLGMLLTPNPEGMGKHEGLFGMPPCGFYQNTGLPCPTCGCTTAVAHFSHGHWLTSLATQPFGFLVAALALVLIPLTGFGLVTGQWRGPSMFFLAWHWRYWVFGGLGILLLGWIYKIISVKGGFG